MKPGSHCRLPIDISFYSSSQNEQDEGFACSTSNIACAEPKAGKALHLPQCDSSSYVLIDFSYDHRTPVHESSFLPSPLTSNPDKSRKSIPTIQPQPGFLGSTSYAAVFTESQNQIGLDADQENGELHQPHSDPTVSSPGKDALIKEGAAVLALLSDFPIYGPFIDQWLDYARGLALIAPFMPECMASIKRDLYDPFVKAKSGRALLHASEMLFTNGAKPMKMDPGMTFRQYHTLFTGDNLRWEALGMVFTAVGLSCSIMLAADTTVDFPRTGTVDKRALAHRMLEASDASIAFCEQTGHLNDPGMWLIYENFLLMSLVIGDSSKSPPSIRCSAVLMCTRLPYMAQTRRSFHHNIRIGTAPRDQSVP